jgi:SAM-dependent methyltransferase
MIEGFYLTLTFNAFLAGNVLERLESGATAEEVARLLGREPSIARALLEFAVETSDVVVRAPAGRYRIRERYATWSALRFHLRKFVGAYGHLIMNLQSGQSLIEPGALASAYAGLPERGPSLPGVLLRRLGVRDLLDLGCGPGRLLLELATPDTKFQGWGIDSDSVMLRLARRRIKQAGFSGRVRVAQHDCRAIDELKMPSLDHVTAIHAGNVMNGLFDPDSDRAVNMVARIRRRFPGRTLYVSDYYGELTYRRRIPRGLRHSVLQDVVQVLSGQGVPEPTLARWLDVYRRAGAELADVVEGSDAGIRWFLHSVQLPG